ncbi:MAG: amino acid ABC transporter permease [Oscillospiraceae bacterium]|nr:amino acid ABC transporter permease [Oscillospiraceae bacterium]
MSFSVIMGRLLESFLINCEIFFITLALGLPFGLVISFGSMSRIKPLRFVTKTFVWIIRGTPLMLQIIVVFYGPGLIWGGDAMGRLEAAMIAFAVNYACYFSEIFRGGIQSISAGQKEAGQVLGMTKSQIFFKITLLQVIKRIVPPMGNEFITLVKDTSLARIIANKEIIMMAQEYVAKALIWPLFSTAIFFLAACGLLTLLLDYTERKLSYFK